MSAEHFSYLAFLVGFAFTGLASVAYVSLPLWPRVVVRQAATDIGATMTVATPVKPPAWLGSSATAMSWLALASLSTSLGARWVAAGRPPYANMWEFTVGFGWGIVLFHALFELRFRLFGGDGSSTSGAAARMVGAVLLPVAFTMFAFALAYFPSNIHPLMPALQANRILGAHVATMT